MRIVDRRRRAYHQHPLLADTPEYQEHAALYVEGPDPEEVRTGACVPCVCVCPACGKERATDVRGWYESIRKNKGLCRPCSNRSRSYLPVLAETDFWKENADLWVDGPDPHKITAGSKQMCTVRCRDCGRERRVPVKAWASQGGHLFCNVCSNRRRRARERAERQAREAAMRQQDGIGEDAA